MPPLFTFTDAAEIALSPYLARAAQRERARFAAHAREAADAHGKSLHVEPVVAKSAQALAAEAHAAFQRAARFAQSPRGRCLAALNDLEPAFPAQAERARAAFTRGLADATVSVSEIGRALTALGDLDSPAARQSCLALAEILTEAFRVATP
jgi:hypothetical protein